MEAHIKELAKVKDESERVYQLFIDRQLDGTGFGRLYKPLEHRRNQLETELPKLQAELDVLKINHLSSDQIVNEARDLYGRWPKFTFDEKRRIVESITQEIVIGKDDVSINLCYLPSCEELTNKHRMLCDEAHGRGVA